MEEFDEDVLENEEIIANVKKILRDGCGCSRGVKGGPRCQQFSEKLVLFNVNNCKKKTSRSFNFAHVSQQIYFSVGKTTF